MKKVLHANNNERLPADREYDRGVQADGIYRGADIPFVEVEGVMKCPYWNTLRDEDPSCSLMYAPPKFTSSDLLLLAHDEWDRREKRRHIHEELPWAQGFINGFLTDKKWAREHLDKIQKDAEGKVKE